jgi:hypothetical protein
MILQLQELMLLAKQCSSLSTLILTRISSQKRTLKWDGTKMRRYPLGGYLLYGSQKCSTAHLHLFLAPSLANLHLAQLRAHPRLLMVVVYPSVQELSSFHLGHQINFSSPFFSCLPLRKGTSCFICLFTNPSAFFTVHQLKFIEILCIRTLNTLYLVPSRTL